MGFGLNSGSVAGDTAFGKEEIVVFFFFALLVMIFALSGREDFYLHFFLLLFSYFYFFSSCSQRRHKRTKGPQHLYMPARRSQPTNQRFVRHLEFLHAPPSPTPQLRLLPPPAPPLPRWLKGRQKRFVEEFGQLMYPIVILAIIL